MVNDTIVPTADIDLIPSSTGGFVELIGDTGDALTDGDTITVYTLLIGPLDFKPEQGIRKTTWYTETIPSTFAPCDHIEVFAAGRRLRKDPLQVYDETLGAVSSLVYKTIEAEFSVDGTNYGTTTAPLGYIRLTSPAPAGTRISVIRRLGKVWYERGETTATSGKTLLENNTPIAKFIAQHTTKLPE